MSSLALARKYRPQGFNAVVGQETTVRILKNALTQKRLHHAYLFTGPRGIGKTTLARIFAKALNCQKTNDPSAEPCNECVSCLEITEGRSLSVQEIDGASNTSVEDVRDLREKIRYLPPGGRYKIYIIDEVHMLSTAAFNALLKTLEEPPPHALFLFATTDAQKMPATVLSRVIRFDLRPISRAAIVGQLKKILASEGVSAEDGALFLIAREAEGGLRDALSLLDQVISFSGGKVALAGVEEIVGVSTRGFVRDFIQAVLAKDGNAALSVSESAFRAGLDVKRMAFDLLETFRHLLVAQISREPALFDLSQEEIDELANLAKPVPPANLDRLFRMTQKGVTDLLRAPLPRVVFDVLALRLANAEDLLPLEEILAALKGTGPVTVPTTAPKAVSPGKNWPGFLSFLKTKSVRLSSLVEEGSIDLLGETEVRLRFPSKSTMTVELLKDPDRDGALSEFLKEYFGRAMKPIYEASAAGVSSKNDGSLLDDAISIFGPADVIAGKRST
jgi:DNA polymerase-3 subunit gamma/tau